MTFPESRLTHLYVEHMRPAAEPDLVTLVRWAERIETFSHFLVARRGWSYEQAGTLADEVRELLVRLRQWWPVWLIDDQHIKAPSEELARHFID
jgi:hypothetical protein